MWRSSCVISVPVRSVQGIERGSLNFLIRVCTLIKNGISGYSTRCTKVHLYWCMRNCGGNPDSLRAMIMNISKHFQVCIYIVGVCACVCVCVCECVWFCVFMCISAFHMWYASLSVIQGDHQSCYLRVPVNSQVTFHNRSLSLCRQLQPLVHMRLHYEKPSSTKTLRSATKAAGRHPVVHSTTTLYRWVCRNVVDHRYNWTTDE